MRIGLADAAGMLAATRTREMPEERGVHDAYLASDVEQMLLAEGVTVSNLSKIAIISGPGSFTGLRIGIAFAKGVAFAAGTPVAPLTLHDVLRESIHREFDPSSEYLLITGSYRKDLFYISQSTTHEIEPIGSDTIESKRAEQPALPCFKDTHINISGEQYTVNFTLSDFAAAARSAPPLATEELEAFEPLYLEAFGSKG